MSKMRTLLHNKNLAVKASIWKALKLLELFVNGQSKGQITKKNIELGNALTTN